jgi:hypothetical protein
MGRATGIPSHYGFLVLTTAKKSFFFPEAGRKDSRRKKKYHRSEMPRDSASCQRVLFRLILFFSVVEGKHVISNAAHQISA